MKKRKEFVMREIAGEYMLVPIGNTALSFNGVITLSDTGAFIWDHLEEAKDVDELVSMICSEYEVDSETARADAIELLSQKEAAGMIEV